ncbi:MAG: TapY2 family type IVa secretion system protein [Shewanella psychromarinicola]|uniref:TapY2 family type IVa secretion system protein n=1 Tax=Shewanella psychromarinicola TaxID=2487742 RepID=UPI0030015069
MIKLLILCLFIVPFGLVAKTDERQDYKCHITSSSVGERILFYRWNKKDANLNEAKLSGKQFKDSASGKKYFIKEVSECLPLGETFKLESAQKLDSQTPR